MKRTRFWASAFLVFACLLSCAGCSKPRVELAVASQPNVNPDHSSRPSPVLVKVYELRNDLAFKQAEFATLFNTPLQVLGADLVATDELVFIPGEARRVAYQPNANTRFVGIIAGFRQMDRAEWRLVKPVNPEEKNWLAFELNDATILTIPDEEAEDWDPEEAVRAFQRQLQQPERPAVVEISPDPPAADPATGVSGEEAGETLGKESLTVINQSGAEIPVPDRNAGGLPETEMVPPAPSLPVMRPL